MKRFFFVAVSFALALTVAPIAARAVTYTPVALGPGPNGKSAYLDGLNASFQGGYYLFEYLSCGKDCSFPVYHAVAWTGANSKPVDITPPLLNFVEAWVYGGGGNVLAGTGITNNGGYFGYPHALVWSGPLLKWTDINPAGATDSYAYATDGRTIAGSVAVSALHATMWLTGNLKAPIDLHPAGYASSEAYGVHGKVQVGYATSSATGDAHAMLWRGTAVSAVDLTPASISTAYATATDGRTQVGYSVLTGSIHHALLWRGTAASMKDLNPAGFIQSYARGVLSGTQAGYAFISGQNYPHAIAWMGTAQSAIDLQSTLPGNYLGSEALGIAANGDILGAALDQTDGAWHAIVWVP